MADLYEPQSGVIGLLTLYLKPEKYIELALLNDVAMNLKSADFRKAYEIGEYPNGDQLAGYKENCIKSAAILKLAIKQSFFWALLAALLALLIMVIAGKFNFNHPISLTKVSFGVGAFLAGWGGALQLMSLPRSYKQTTLAEKVHSALTYILFFPISVLAFIQAIF